MTSKGEKINLVGYMMNKMLLTLKEKKKEVGAKKKSSLQQMVFVPYMILITHYVKYLGSSSSKYELILIAVTYDLGSISNMEYKDPNNDGKYVKVQNVQDNDDEDKAASAEGQAVTPPIQDQATPSLAQVMDVLGQIQLSVGHLHE